MAQHEQVLWPPIGEPVKPSPGVPWGLADVALALGFLVGAALLIMVPAATAAVIVAGDAGLTDSEMAVAIFLGAQVAFEVALLGIAVLFTIGKYNCPWSSLGVRWPQRGGLWLPVLVVFGGYLFVLIYFGILQAIGASDFVPETNVPEAAFDSATSIGLLAVLSLLAAPVMEETFFRGFVFAALRSRWGLLWAAPASGFLFALAHIDPGLFIPFTAIGILFALAYAWSGSLLVTVLAHFGFNGISFLIAIAGGGS